MPTFNQINTRLDKMCLSHSNDLCVCVQCTYFTNLHITFFSTSIFLRFVQLEMKYICVSLRTALAIPYKCAKHSFDVLFFFSSNVRFAPYLSFFLSDFQRWISLFIHKNSDTWMLFGWTVFDDCVIVSIHMYSKMNMNFSCSWQTHWITQNIMDHWVFDCSYFFFLFDLLLSKIFIRFFFF